MSEGKPTSEEVIDLKSVMAEWEEAVVQKGGMFLPLPWFTSLLAMPLAGIANLLREHDAAEEDDEEGGTGDHSMGEGEHKSHSEAYGASPSPDAEGIEVEDATMGRQAASRMAWGGEDAGDSENSQDASPFLDPASVSATKPDAGIPGAPRSYGMHAAPSYERDELWMAMPIKCFKTALLNLFSVRSLGSFGIQQRALRHCPTRGPHRPCNLQTQISSPFKPANP